MTEREFSYREPHKRQAVSVMTLAVGDLEVVEHQRKTRPAHVKNLISSIERIGFIVPLVAFKDRDGTYIVIDGQHRLLAAEELGIKKLPVLVVPAKLAPRMMNLNVEKDLNIREKAVVSLGIYRAFLAADTGIKENDPEIEESIERAYYVTLGYAYEGNGRLAGGAFEPLLKKCDFFMRRTLENAHPAREERAIRVLDAYALMKDVISKAKEMGAFHQYFQYQLIASVDPFKRKRGRQNFDDMFDQVTAKLTKLNDDPSRIRRLGGD